jgi:hypothetical protein
LRDFPACPHYIYMRKILLPALLFPLVLWCQDKPRPASCPDSVYVAGNNPAAVEFRRLYERSKDLKLSSRKDGAAAVLEVELREVTISATLVGKGGDLVWSGSATAGDYPGVVLGLRRLMVEDLHKGLMLRACGRLPSK